MNKICGKDGCTATTHSRKSHSTIEWQRANPEAAKSIRERAKATKLRELAANPGDPRHGLSSSYVAGCRCEACTAAHLASSRKRKNRQRYGVLRAAGPGAPESMVGVTFPSKAAAESYIASHAGNGKSYRVFDRTKPVELLAGNSTPRRTRLPSAASRSERLASLQSNPSDSMHGTNSGYIYGCRCARCSQAAREYDRARRASLPYRVAKVAADGLSERILAETFRSHQAAEQWVAARPNAQYRIIDTRLPKEIAV